MQQPGLIAFAILLNVAAQLSIKLAGQQTEFKSLLHQILSPWLISAILLYGFSFLMTVRIYAVNQLSTAAPFMAACTFVLIYLVGYFLLGEAITIGKVAGLVLIIIGLALLLQ
ncbi:MAG: hypothetical protein VR73_07620 [Gammaproteobacteria bacterium BRH_c0]|nr:MAG: hypothetical protein VR73_07620 [Gammaproteobacteria bacterium BRH_c0]